MGETSQIYMCRTHANPENTKALILEAKDVYFTSLVQIHCIAVLVSHDLQRKET